MANVKCQVTGESIDKKIAYPVNINGRNKYYKSKDVYDKFMQTEDYKIKIRKMINEILGVDEHQVLKKDSAIIYHKYLKDIGVEIFYHIILHLKNELIEFTSKIPNQKGRVLYILKVVKENVKLGIYEMSSKSIQDNTNIDMDFYDEINSSKMNKKNKLNIEKYLDN